MKHPERIEDFLQHIAEAIVRVTGYVQGIDNAAALERDHKTQAAVIRYIEIIGEAANRIQKQEPEFVAAHPSLPWHEMRVQVAQLLVPSHSVMVTGTAAFDFGGGCAVFCAD
jgi:uncharacterized protein with HEPN domain